MTVISVTQTNFKVVHKLLSILITLVVQYNFQVDLEKTVDTEEFWHYGENDRSGASGGHGSNVRSDRSDDSLPEY